MNSDRRNKSVTNQPLSQTAGKTLSSEFTPTVYKLLGKKDFRKSSAVCVNCSTKLRPTLVCKVKVKCTLVQALRLCTGRTAHGGSREITLPFLWPTALEEGEKSASRPSPFLPQEKSRYPLYRRLGGPQGRSGQMRKISLPPGFDSRTVQPLASRHTYYATRPAL